MLSISKPHQPRSFSFSSLRILLSLTALVSMFVPVSSYATSLPQNPARITQAVDDSVLTTLKGNVHPLATVKNDKGAASPGLPLKRMLLVLKRGDVQEAALKTLLDQQQDKHSSSYRQWLTPTQLGQDYGPAPADIKIVTAWLESHGFQIGSVSKSGMFVEFSGTAGQVASAFHTEMHSYMVEGALRYANASDPKIPSALAPVVAGIASLSNFPVKPNSRMAGNFRRDKATGQVTRVPGLKSNFTYPVSSTENVYAVGPYDLATIYNISPLWQEATPLDGTGQTIAIVAETDVNPQDAYDFRTIFGLPTGGSLAAFQQKYLNVIENGPDPGNIGGGDEFEANVDIQWSGAVAKGANIDFVVSQSTTTTYGFELSALYIVDNNLAPVMSQSYGYCELFLGTTGNTFHQQLWEQASAQGISVFVASGDGGATACDQDSSKGAQYGAAVQGHSSTPFNVAVGGTDFDQIGKWTSYWSATNNSTTQASALSYIPEATWNNSCTNSLWSSISGSTDPITNCNDSDVVNDGGLGVGGGTGGPSSCIASNGQDPASCAGGYAKPSWQVGSYADGVRDVPDVSLFASNGFENSFYIICVSDDSADGTCNLDAPYQDFLGVGGTSVASPAIAGMFSILSQKLGERVGNPNYGFYNLAAKETASTCSSTSGPGSSCVFNDITKGTISQPCTAGSTDCYSGTVASDNGVVVSDNGSGYSKPDSSGYPGDLAWNTAVGYDYGTGLGSVNAANLVNSWSTVDFLASTTTLSLSSTSLTHGTAVNATVDVTSNTGTPSGDVSFNAPGANGAVGYATLSAGKVTTAINDLPGGSYNLIAHYGGNNDGTNIFAGSDSNPVAVTIAPESSTTALTTIFYNVTNNSFAPGTTATYGSYFFIPRVDVAGASGNGVATGTVAITANGTPLDGSPFKLNSTGNAEDQNWTPNAGSYTMSGSYSGDPSFNASTGTVSLTITQATPVPTLTSTATSVTLGTSVTLNSVFDTTTYVGSAPTGTVTFYAASTALGSPVSVVAGADGSGFPEATASLATTALPIGANSVTAKYIGDVNYMAVTSPAVVVTVTAPTPTLAISGTAVAAVTQGASGTSAITVTPSGGFTGAVNLTCSVAGPSGATSPATCSYNPASVTIAGTTAGNSVLTVATASTTTAGSYTVSLNAADAATGLVTATSTLPVTVNAAAFSGSVTLAATAVTISGAGQSGSSTITVTPSSSATGTGTLSLTCALTTSPSGATAPPSCTLSPASVTLSGSTAPAAVTATISTTANSSGALAYPQTNRDHRWYTAGGGAALACVLFFGIPARRRSWRAILGLLVFLVAMAGMGCGGGSKPSGGTTAGSYTFTVTGTIGTATPTTTSLAVTVN